MKKQIIEKYENANPLSVAYPNAAFLEFYEKHKSIFKDLILPLKDKDKNLNGLSLRIGMAYPLNIIINEEIKEFCAIPFRRIDGSLAACEGITENWKACPPHSPKVDDTIKLLEKAVCFLVFQFDGITNVISQKHIHIWTLKIEKLLKENNYAILEGYSCGPCRICKECSNDICRAPEQRRFALESCGIWVNYLCKKAGEYPVSNDKLRTIDWVIDWDLPTQTPKTYKSVTGILLTED